MTGRLLQRCDLSAAEHSAMYALLDTHFEGVRRDQFDADLSEKNWVVLVEEGGQLFGFSTIHAYESELDGERVSVVYSGDTIVSPAAWGSAAFPRAWIHAVYELREQYPSGRLIWLLLTSGFRTYRFLPVFWSEFYPRTGVQTPAAWQKLMNRLATARFGDRYDLAAGIVRLVHPQQLRGRLREISQENARNPHVAFFLARNPGHERGDELVCVTDLRPENLTRAGRRVVYGTAR